MKKRKQQSKPSAMSQVGNKARLGIINYMVEEDSLDKDSLWSPVDGYATPDFINFSYEKHKYFGMYDVDYWFPYPFFIQDGKVCLGKCGGTHEKMSKGEKYFWPGRIFLKQGLIMFWGEDDWGNYEIPSRAKLNDIIKGLDEQFKKKTPEEYNLFKNCLNDLLLLRQMSKVTYACRVKDYIKGNLITPDNVKKHKNMSDWSRALIAGKEKYSDYLDSIYADKVYKNFLLRENMRLKDVDLSSFKQQKKLNPKFWTDDKMNSEIRLKLMDIANDFLKDLNVPWVKPKDMIVTGSLANYGWNKKYSDVDLHIVIDFKEVDEKIDFVEQYFKAKKNVWNNRHEDLTIYSYPIEVYVQDINDKSVFDGVYSLYKNKWIKKPTKKSFDISQLDVKLIKKKVVSFVNRIDELEKNLKRCKGDSFKLNQVQETSKELFDELINYRRNSLKEKQNEMTEGNIVFKTLRRLNYIDKLNKLKTKSYDLSNSL